jgi:hypothetical protein
MGTISRILRSPEFWSVAVLTLIFGSISACTWPPTPTATPNISSDKAIELAIGDCRIPHLVLVGEPTNIHTKLLTLGETGFPNDGIPMDTMVWLVQMDGQLQLVGGPAPIASPDGRFYTPTPSQPFWGTCTVILDANSGRLYGVRG